jgi:hypothetical protein
MLQRTVQLCAFSESHTESMTETLEPLSPRIPTYGDPDAERKRCNLNNGSVSVQVGS